MSAYIAPFLKEAIIYLFIYDQHMYYQILYIIHNDPMLYFSIPKKQCRNYKKAIIFQMNQSIDHMIASSIYRAYISRTKIPLDNASSVLRQENLSAVIIDSEQNTYYSTLCYIMLHYATLCYICIYILNLKRR